LAIDVSDDSGSSWVELEDIAHASSSGESISGSRNYDLASYVSLTADMAVRFRISAGFGGSGQHVTFDGVQIIATVGNPAGTTAFSSASDTASITVTPVNDAPTITPIVDQTAVEDTATGDIAFKVGDIETAAASLTVTATSSD